MLVMYKQMQLNSDIEARTCISTDSIFGIELIRYVTVIFPSMALSDGGFHEAREGWQDIDGRINTLVM